jgi:hypothetical protein
MPKPAKNSPASVDTRTPCRMWHIPRMAGGLPVPPRTRRFGLGMPKPGKEIVCANRQYSSIEDQVTRFTLYLQSLTPAEALWKAGVYSHNFWLYT